MHALDWVLVGVLVIAAWHGYHVGAAAQLLSFAGFLLGLTIGVALVLSIAPHLANPAAKTGVSIACLLVPATALGGLGRHFGFVAFKAMRRLRVGLVDTIGGAVIAVAGTLVVFWLFASILVNSAATGLSQTISSSTVIQHVERIMPPVPTAFSAIERYLTHNGFPDVLINVLPESPTPVALANNATVVAAVRAAGTSVVKIEATGCGDIQEGSGFTTTDGLVVTNAHVVAGTNHIAVLTRGGVATSATPVLFDPKLDLAVLRTGPLGIPDLTIDPGYAQRGNAAVVLGYPGGGPFSAVPAGVLARFDAQGRDIYDSAITTRIVYELDAVVRPGNSGGPLVAANGEVLGVVFSRSVTNPDIGYALATPAVAAEVATATREVHQVSTGDCIA